MDSLIFIYNAESGLSNALLDTGRRIFNPSKYPCALCMVTYGPFGMKDDWKTFVTQLPYNVIFLHSDELSEELKKMQLELPSLVLQRSGTATVLIGGQEFRTIKDLDSLKLKVTEALKRSDIEVDNKEYETSA